MRDFFINTFEKLVAVIIVLLAIGAVVGAFGAAMEGGIIAFVAVLVFGAVYVIAVGGFMYLGLGIYRNTQRTADALERQFGDKG